MAETIENHGSSSKWHWYNVMKDLIEQGGLEGVTVNPLSVHDHGCGGITQAGTIFTITWVQNCFLLVSVTQEEEALIEAFSKVVEYTPFCKYISKESGLLTFEWDKDDPDGRFLELQKAEEKELKKL